MGELLGRAAGGWRRCGPGPWPTPRSTGWRRHRRPWSRRRRPCRNPRRPAGRRRTGRLPGQPRAGGPRLAGVRADLRPVRGRRGGPVPAPAGARRELQLGSTCATWPKPPRSRQRLEGRCPGGRGGAGPAPPGGVGPRHPLPGRVADLLPTTRPHRSVGPGVAQNIYYFAPGDQPALLARLRGADAGRHGGPRHRGGWDQRADPAAAHLDLVLRSTVGSVGLPTGEKMVAALVEAGFARVEQLAPGNRSGASSHADC